MTQAEKIEDMVSMFNRYEDDYITLHKKFAEAYSVDHALEIIKELHEQMKKFHAKTDCCNEPVIVQVEKDSDGNLYLEERGLCMNCLEPSEL
tara:strand:+ start:50 stop:325 length:276 start_codon:yes stop_codon:yes gene_type:complete